MLEWIPWQDAAEMAAATATTWGITNRTGRSWGRALRPWAKELTLILLLYGLWQYAGEWSLGHVNVAMARGRSIWNAERAWHLPSERAIQALFLHHRLALRGFNDFYALVHAPALAICLVWLFVRHRHHYPPVRTVLAMVTAASLVIQLFPVAPPRLLPLLGVVDTGALIGPRVYSPGAPGLDQLSAMPSLHVAWSIVIAGAIVWVCRRRWRWLALAYPILTIVTVVVTGNHFWADGIVAAALCVVATLIVARLYARPSASPTTSSSAYPSNLRLRTRTSSSW
ncbi:MAG: phosphatase PAP2 family protein [Actinomycetota bacterium]|nr:phosphatase PAP2 family protein [Actinomycetota bacterium]